MTYRVWACFIADSQWLASSTAGKQERAEAQNFGCWLHFRHFLANNEQRHNVFCNGVSK